MNGEKYMQKQQITIIDRICRGSLYSSDLYHQHNYKNNYAGSDSQNKSVELSSAMTCYVLRLTLTPRTSDRILRPLNPGSQLPLLNLDQNCKLADYFIIKTYMIMFTAMQYLLSPLDVL